MTRSRLFRASCLFAILASSCFVACSGWSPSRPFEREAPEVRESIALLGDAGDAAAAGGILEEYLVTGQCKEGNIGTPNRVRERSSGAFDLGLALFKIGETFGRRFGEEEIDGGHMDGPLKTLRQAQVECGLRIVRAVATDPSQPLDLRARARFLEGNLCFLDQRYEDAVKAYDQSLELIPGMLDAGPVSATDSGRSIAVDTLGRDTAWNRAIALRRIEDKKDAGNDGGNDGGGEGGSDAGGDGGNDDKNKDGGGDGDGGDKNDSGAKPDAGKDASSDPKNDEKPKEDPKDAGPPPPSRQNQDERILDQLENAPTVQQEAAKKQAGKRRVRGISDK
ncbi:MAG: tetratricopeptide repeat protein [Deltaproteobacteria bacterium]|nr:tetratricopeptide repeat protein [Deltaproteobacteria bacterium]